MAPVIKLKNAADEETVLRFSTRKKRLIRARTEQVRKTIAFVMGVLTVRAVFWKGWKPF